MVSRRQILKLIAAAGIAPLLPGKAVAGAVRDLPVSVLAARQDQMLRVMSYNVWGVPTSIERPARMTAIGHKLASMNIDIVGLQECWLEADRERLLSGLAGSELRYTHFYPAGLMGSGLLLLSRFPIVDVGFHRYSLNGQPLTFPEVDYYGGKGIGYAALDTPYGEITVFNTHIIAQYGGGPDDLFYAHRAAQAYEFVRYVNALVDGRPVIAMGDFNLNSDKVGYQVVETLGAFTNSYLSVHGSDAHFSGLIDHIFIRGGDEGGFVASIVDAAPLPPSQSAGLERLSDHPAVTAELTLGPSPDAGGETTRVAVVLRDLLAILDEGILSAITRSQDHNLRAGISLAAFIGAEALSDELQSYRSLWGRLLRLSGLIVALPVAVSHAWLGRMVGLEEITTLNGLAQEVRILLGRYRADA